MKDVKEIIRIYTEKLNWIYSKANTKSKKKKIVYDLFSFSEICHEHFNINEDFIWENDNELTSLIVNPDMYFIDNILNSKILFNDISNSVITTFKDSKFPFYKNQGKVLNSLTSEKISEIVLDFISEYDNNLLKLYEDKLYNNEIFIGNLFENTGGLTYQLNTLNKTWIFMNSELDHSILFASTIVHELGHAYEDDILNKTGLFKRMTQIAFLITFSELFRILNATAKDIGPTRPKYIVAIIMHLPKVFKKGVRFLDKPTVAVALTVS